MRLGLERAGVEVVWANDIDAAKQEMYEANFGSDDFELGDIRDVDPEQIPDVDIATASFPCTDLSLAGNRKGLGAQAAPKGAYWESSMFWEFLRVIEHLGERRPPTLLLENVLGFATSNQGRDLVIAIGQLNRLGYSCDVLTVNALHFVPQSRPRLFIVATRAPIERSLAPVSDVRPAWVAKLADRNPELSLHALPLPRLPEGPSSLDEQVERLARTDPMWWDAERVARFRESLSPVQCDRVAALVAGASTSWRTAYRRTREGVARWEIRADGIAGCLRTARGGSSKQALVEAGHGELRVRWMTAKEYAALQGAPDFILPRRRNQALFGFGDAVCVPVIAWLVEHAVEPVARREALPLAA